MKEMQAPAPFVLRLRTCIAVGLVATAIVCGDGGAATVGSPRFYDDAVARFERDDIAGAIIQLNNALQKEPNNLAAHVLLGKARLRNSDPAGAEESFQKALRLGVDRSEVALPLAQAYYAQGKYDALLEGITPSGLPRQSQIEILVIRGNAQADRGNTAGALRAYEDARALDSKSIPVRIALTALLLRTGEKTRAAALLEETLKLAPNESALWNLRASMEHINGQYPAALADYAKAIALDPNNMDALIAHAGLLLDLGRQEEAEAALTSLLEKSPKEPRAAYLRAVAASRRNDRDVVRTQLTSVVNMLDPVPKEVLVRNAQLLLLGGLAHYDLGNKERASQYLASYVTLNPKQPGPSKLLATIYLERGETQRALELLEPLQYSASNDPQLLALLAAANMTLRRYNQATSYMERAVKLSAGAPAFRTQFAVSLMGSGQSDVGFSQLQQAFAADPGQPRAGMIMTTFYLKRDEPKKAVEVIDAVVRRDPKNVDAVNLQGIARAAAGDLAGARASYESALLLKPSFHAARLNLARVDIAEGKLDRARGVLTEMLRTDPKNGDAMFELALVEERAGDNAAAMRHLEQAMTLPRLRVQAGVSLVELLLRQRDFERALRVANDVVGRAPNDLVALYAQARAHTAIGDTRRARQTLRTMGPLAGFDPRANLDIARLQFAVGDRENAMYTLSKVLKEQPDDLRALVLLAEAEIANKEYSKAEQHAKRLSDRYPGRGAGPRLMGDLAAARGQYPAAISSYRTALSKEKSVDTVERLYRTYRRTGDVKTALAFLEQWSKDNPEDFTALRALADGRRQTGDLANARADYERLLQRNSNDVEVLNNLAQVSLQMGDKSALEYAERAYQLASKNAAVLDTLGWVLVQRGDLDRGTGLLRDARLRDSTSAEIRYHLASALAKSGREAEARKELKEGLASNSQFPELEDARKLQQKLGH